MSTTFICHIYYPIISKNSERLTLVLKLEANSCCTYFYKIASFEDDKLVAELSNLDVIKQFISILIMLVNYNLGVLGLNFCLKDATVLGFFCPSVKNHF